MTSQSAIERSTGSGETGSILMFGFVLDAELSDRSAQKASRNGGAELVPLTFLDPRGATRMMRDVGLAEQRITHSQIT